MNTAPQRQVEIVPYDFSWPVQFEELAAELNAAFGELLVTVHHIGSTSVTGLVAKPIIDMLPEVSDISHVDQLNPKMAALGYEALGEFGLPRRRYFRRLDGARHLVHVHTYQGGNPEITRHLAFRDYLKAHQEVAAQYAHLKIALAKQFPHDAEAYQQGKQAWIEAAKQIALNWHMSA